eukprot:95215-Amorphochlora_amoeboformis.AAC.1
MSMVRAERVSVCVALEEGGTEKFKVSPGVTFGTIKKALWLKKVGFMMRFRFAAVLGAHMSVGEGCECVDMIDVHIWEPGQSGIFRVGEDQEGVSVAEFGDLFRRQ